MEGLACISFMAYAIDLCSQGVKSLHYFAEKIRPARINVEEAIRRICHLELALHEFDSKFVNNTMPGVKPGDMAAIETVCKQAVVNFKVMEDVVSFLLEPGDPGYHAHLSRDRLTFEDWLTKDCKQPFRFYGNLGAGKNYLVQEYPWLNAKALPSGVVQVQPDDMLSTSMYSAYTDRTSGDSLDAKKVFRSCVWKIVVIREQLESIHTLCEQRSLEHTPCSVDPDPCRTNLRNTENCESYRADRKKFEDDEIMLKSGFGQLYTTRIHGAHHHVTQDGRESFALKTFRDSDRKSSDFQVETKTLKQLVVDWHVGHDLSMKSAAEYVKLQRLVMRRRKHMSDALGGTDNSSTSPLSNNDMVDCCQTLLGLMENPNLQFANFSCLISCVLNTARPLHKLELEAALRLHKLQDDIQENKQDESNASVKWLMIYDGVFRQDDKGYIHFRNQAMPAFLHNFRIDGIDPSHKTIATICLAAIKEYCRASNDHNVSSKDEDAFTAYSHEFWRFHCKEAAKSSLALEIGHITRVGAQLDRSPSAGDNTAKLLQQQMENLDMTDEGEGWVVLGQDNN